MRRSRILRCVVIVTVGSLLLAVHSVAAADCNGNGLLDVEDLSSGRSEDCNANGIPDECEVSPLPFSTALEIPVSGFPRFFATADFDDNGLIDVATTTSALASGISILLHRDRGEFDETVHDTERQASSLTTADVDGDGAIDVVAIDSSSFVVLSNRGDGTFETPVSFEAPSPHEFVTGDLDGDGAADLVLSHSSAHRLAVIFSRSGRTFGDPVEYEVSASRNLVGLEDLDGDGDLDLAGMNRRSGDVSIFHNDGDGTFVPGAVLAGKAGDPQALTMTDFNGDGLPEIAVMSRISLTFYRNRGQSFDDAVTFEVGVSFRTLLLEDLGTGDVDGDGDVDLVLGTVNADTIIGVYNSGDGTFSAVRRLSLRDVFRPMTLVDLDLDGAPDVVGVMGGRLQVVFNDRVAAGYPVSLSASTLPVGREPHFAVMDDLDGDGDLDVAVIDGETVVLIIPNDGKGGLSNGEIIGLTGAQELISLSAADLDGDGDIDLVAVDEHGMVFVVFRDPGGYRFTPYVVGGELLFVTTADLDGDGVPAILGANRGHNSVSVMVNAGDGSFPEVWEIPVGNTPRFIATGHLDGDANLDIAVTSRGSSQVSLFFGDGQGSFPGRVDLDVEQPAVVKAGDVDGDGDVDLAVSGVVGVVILANEGNREFRRWTALAANLMSSSVILADIDGDGRLDILGSGGFGSRFAAILNRGNDTFSEPFFYAVGRDPRFVVAGDLDGDGDTDLVAANHTSDSLTVLTNQSPARLSRASLGRVCTSSDFFRIAVPSSTDSEVAWSTKYVVPVDPANANLLPTLFQDVRRHGLHQEFLAAEYPDRFPVLDNTFYDRLVGRRATRQYFVGAVHLLRTRSGPIYGFNVLASFLDDPTELPTPAEVEGVYDSLRAVFEPGPLVYYPDSPLAREDASSWEDPDFPLYLEGTTTTSKFEAYTRGTGVGRVRLLDRESFQAANSSGRISFQDILVLSEAPRDIEGVFGGVVTAVPQVALSHVAVRSARRGTPNAYVANALEEFADLEGQLIRLVVSGEGYTTEEVTPEAARVWWEERRPSLSELPGVDGTYRALDDFTAMDLSSVEEAQPEHRYGGKASNLARLQRILDGPREKYIEVGFSVPVYYYLEFARGNTLPSIRDPEREVTYQEYLEELDTWPEFRSDSELRFRVLDDLRDHMRKEGEVDADLVSRLAVRIEEVFGGTGKRVRFRSSSNVEDILEFNGAGLYDSTSACAADDLDGDTTGPSLCDTTRPDERGIERALKKVWSSLWSYRAYEERAFFGIPQGLSAMGILVSRSFPDERVNGVALTGNPSSSRDRRYVVSAQLGEVSVVSPDPGVVAETDLLRVEEGVVVEIDRASYSSLLPPGVFVLSVAELEELGGLLWHLDHEFPVDTGDYPRDDVLLDIEFKIEPDGSLAVKQVRPFLRRTPLLPTPSFELVIPAGARACGTFVQARSARSAYELKSTVVFVSGTHVLPTESSTFSANLVEEVRVGPGRELAVSTGPGTFGVTSTLEGEEATYRFRYTQEFTLEDGSLYSLSFSSLSFRAREEEALEESVVLDEAYITDELVLQGNLGLVVSYSSCGDELLALWEIEVDLEDGSRIRLLERHEPPPTINGTGPASVVHASLELVGFRREVSDYWHLVYSALRHNRGIRHWVVLDPAARIPGVEGEVKFVEVVAPEERFGITEELNYLGPDYSLLAMRRVTSYSRQRISAPGEVLFQRGDVQADGVVGLDDAVSLLEQLFRGGRATVCRKAADANDDGRVNISDAVAILHHLFRGAGFLPEPAGECGVDPTDDGLACPAHGACSQN